ncbi:MAG: carbon storage regulator CsrA [Sphingomonadales bacterium]|nr:carbon storage regulator CsrA [Sphingomonadales bacterium]
MLVLTRRAGESIVIGDEVRVVVLDVRGDTVRLGIEAPRSVQVHRAEVYAEVQAAIDDFNAALAIEAVHPGTPSGRSTFHGYVITQSSDCGSTPRRSCSEPSDAARVGNSREGAQLMKVHAPLPICMKH